MRKYYWEMEHNEKVFTQKKNKHTYVQKYKHTVYTITIMSNSSKDVVRIMSIIVKLKVENAREKKRRKSVQTNKMNYRADVQVHWS